MYIPNNQHLFTGFITHQMAPWSTVRTEKLTGFQLVKKLPTFYGTWRFITAFTRARNLFRSWDRWVLPSHLLFEGQILILSFHSLLDFPSDPFPQAFTTKTPYAPLLSAIQATCLTHLILLDFVAGILVRSTDGKAPHYVVFSVVLLPHPY